MSKANIDQVISSLQEKFNDQIIVEDQYDFKVVTVSKDKIKEAVKYLFDHNDYRFRFLTTMCGLHFPDEKLSFGMMIQLHSLENNLRIRLKSFTSKEDLQFETLTDIFPSANWMEREAWDFYGIKFRGHPNLIRILNVEDMDYFPMRKEYGLEDATRTDKNDTMFGRIGNSSVTFTEKNNEYVK